MILSDLPVGMRQFDGCRQAGFYSKSPIRLAATPDEETMSIRLKNLFIAPPADRAIYGILDLIPPPRQDVQTLTATRTQTDGWKLEPFDLYLSFSRDAIEEQHEYWASATVEIPELGLQEQRPVSIIFDSDGLETSTSADFSELDCTSSESQEKDAMMLVHFELETPEKDSVKTTHNVVVRFSDDLINSL